MQEKAKQPLTPYAKDNGAGRQSYLEEHRKLKRTSNGLPGTQPTAEHANYGITPPADYWLGYPHGRATAKTWVTQRPSPQSEEDTKNRKPKYNLSAGKQRSGGVSPRRKTSAEINTGQNETLAIRLPTALVVHLRHWAFVNEVSLVAFIEEALTRFCQELTAENKKQVQEAETAKLLSVDASLDGSLITKREKQISYSPSKTLHEKKLRVGVFAR